MVTLDGSGSRDPDGSIGQYRWSEGGETLGTGRVASVPFGLGIHEVVLTVTGDTGFSATDTARIVVEALAKAPLADAGPDIAVADSNGDGWETVQLDGTASSDPDGRIVSCTWSQGGVEVAEGATPVVTLPVGVHELKLTVTDNDGFQAWDLVSVTVGNIPNRSPRANDVSVKTQKNAALSIDLDVEDPDGDALTCVVASRPSHGTLTDSLGRTITQTPFALPPGSCTVTYAPDRDYWGPDAFLFWADDHKTCHSNSAFVNIDVRQYNYPPSAFHVTVSAAGDSTTSISLNGVDADPLTYWIQSLSSHGTLRDPIAGQTISATPYQLRNEGKTVQYTPDSGYVGPDKFTYRAHDGRAYSNYGNVSITVKQPNRAPAAYTEAFVVVQGEDRRFELKASDEDPLDDLNFTILSLPSSGTLINPGPSPDVAVTSAPYTLPYHDEELIYRPAPDFSGSASFIFRVDDGSSQSSVATVTLIVGPAAKVETWPVEILDDSGSTLAMDVARTPAGLPAVSYVSSAGDRQLRYAEYNATTGEFDFTVVDETRGVDEKFTSLAFDPNTGQPGIAYKANGSPSGTPPHGLFYAWRDTSRNWRHTQIETNWYAGYGACLRYNPRTGRPAIAYSDRDAAVVKFAWHDGRSWVIEVADRATDSEMWDRITFEFDSAGQPHLVYTAPEKSVRGMRRADRNPNGTWTNDTIYPGRSQRRPESVRLGPNHFALVWADTYWSDDNYEGLRYVEFLNGHWGTVTGIVSGDIDRKSVDIAVAPNTIEGYAQSGEPAIIFIDTESEGETLGYVTRMGGTWYPMQVGTTISNYAYSSLGFDQNGMPLVAVRDSAKNELNLARPLTTLDVFVDPTGSGTVSRAPNGSYYSGSDTVQLTANPAPGWVFSHWAGDVPDGIGNDDSINVLMDRKRTLTAHFGRAYSLTVSAVPATGGEVDVLPDEQEFLAGAVVQLQARAEGNARFDKWSGDVPAGREFELALSVPMNRNRELTANFDLAPIAQPDTFSVDEDQEKVLALTASDDRVNPPEIVVVVPPSHGTLSLGEDSLHPIYHPHLNWHGKDTFVYQAFDGALYSDEVLVTINVQPVNDAPTDVTVSNALIPENEPAGTTVGELKSDDVDPGDILTYSLVSGQGATDNSLFSIVGSTLRTKTVLDHETQNSYTIRVRSKDGGGLSKEKVFVIYTKDVNEPPGVVLQNTVTSLEEGADTTRIKVADIEVSDDALGTNRPSLSGPDAAMFEIVGTELHLKAAQTLDHETNPVLNVIVEVDDPEVGSTPDDTAALVIEVTDAPPADCELRISDVKLAEGTSETMTFEFMVNLLPASVETVLVDFATALGTATPDEDYVETGGTLTFLPGVTSQPIYVEIARDAITEPDETFYVNLSNARGAVIADGEAVGTIANDDLHALYTSYEARPEGDTGTTTFWFTVVLHGKSDIPACVDYATRDDTADAGTDYVATNGTLCIPPGPNFDAIDVQVLGDNIHEPMEKFFLELRNPRGAVIGSGQGLGQIVNDDIVGITVTPSSGLTTTEAGGSAEFTVVLDSQPTAPVAIGLRSSDATEGNVAPRQIVFDAGNWNTPQAVTVTGVEDDDSQDVTYTIVTEPATSTDPDYDGFDAVDVSLTNIDKNSPPGEIRGTIWYDLVPDGRMEDGEPGLPDRGVFLDINKNGQPDDVEPRRTTDSQGHYVFADVPPGMYDVREISQPEWLRTFPAEDGLHTVTVVSGAIVERVDFGGQPLERIELPRIASYISRFDVDADGDQDLLASLESGGLVVYPFENGLPTVSEPFAVQHTYHCVQDGDYVPQIVQDDFELGPGHSNRVTDVVVHDVSDDDYPDLFIAARNTNFAYVLWEMVSMRTDEYYGVRNGNTAWNRLVLSDLDGDKKADLVATGPSDVRVTKGEDLWIPFSWQSVFSLGGTWDFGRGMDQVDWNVDGKPDLAVGGVTNELVVLTNHGNPEFTDHVLGVTDATIEHVVAVQGSPERWIATATTQDIIVWTNGKTEVPGTLTLEIAEDAISENDGATSATVTRSGVDVSQTLTVTLTTSDESEATVPSSVEIPANESSVSFTVQAVDDVVADGTQTVTITASATGFTSGTDMVEVTDQEGLTVVEVTPTSFGVGTRFSADLAASVLNMYDQGNVLGPPDVVVSGANQGIVRGSLVVAPDLRQITFIKTGNSLQPDTYTVTMQSGPNAICDTAGNLLDGNGDGIGGDAFVGSFVIDAAPTHAVTVSLPDIVVGYGQTVNLPANDPTAGFPLTVSNGAGVSGIDLKLRYDPALLKIETFILKSGIAARGGQATLTSPSPGTAILTISAPTSLATSPGPLTVGSFVARVPDKAPYAAKHVVDVTDLHVYDNAADPSELPPIADSAIHVAAFFGDVNGSRSYNAPDAILAQRYIVQMNSGTSAFQTADPILVGDITLNGALQSADVTSIQRAIVHILVPNIPPLPADILLAPAGGPDPIIYVPTDLKGARGSSVTVPVKIEITEADGITISGFDVVIEFDSDKFAVGNAQMGDLLSGRSFSGLLAQPSPGTIIYTASSPQGTTLLPNGTTGDLFTLTFDIKDSASEGPAAINLRSSYVTTPTAVFTNDLIEATLNPAPTNNPDDSVDGVLTILPDVTTTPVVTVHTLRTNDPTPTITGTVSGGTLQTVVVDGKVYVLNDGNLSVDGTKWRLQIPMRNALEDETYDVDASAINEAGIVGRDGTTDELVIDTTAPLVTVDVLTTSDTTPTITGTVTEGTLQVTLVDKTYGSNDTSLSVDGTHWKLLIPDAEALEYGTYDVRASAVDEAGNVGHDGTTDELTIATATQGLIHVELVPVASPSPVGADALPEAVSRVALGSTYYLELWVQNRGDQPAGIQGGSVDVHFSDTTLVDVRGIVHEDCQLLPTGEILDDRALIDDLGGARLDVDLGVTPKWLRMAYAEVVPTGLGQVAYSLEEGQFRFAVAGAGNVDWNQVDLKDTAQVDHVGGGQVDVRLVRTPTSVDVAGQVEAIPGNERYFDEWEPFWTEVWLSTPNTDVSDIAGADVSLAYTTDLTTAKEIEFGPSFTTQGAPIIDDRNGQITGIHAVATAHNWDDNRPVLVARVLFEPTSDDHADINMPNKNIGPYRLTVAPQAAELQLSGESAPVPAQLGAPAATDVYAVPFDMDDSDLVDFGDFSLFAPHFGEPVGPADAIAWLADFDKSGVIDFGDFAFFAPAFGKSKPRADIGYPDSYPDAWRPVVAEGEGVLGAVPMETMTTIDLELVVLSEPSATDLRDVLPESLTDVPAGSTYFVEIWGQQTDGRAGISGGSIDIRLAPDDHTEILGLSHGGIYNVLTMGTFADTGVDDFGGGTFDSGVGVAPGWVRLGWTEVTGTALGEVAYTVEPGAIQFSLSGLGNVPWSQVDMDAITVSNGSPWQNPLNRFDVNADRNVTPLDVLTLISDINLNGARDLPIPSMLTVAAPYLDPDGSGGISPVDVLFVINHIDTNGNTPVSEPGATSTAPVSPLGVEGEPVTALSPRTGRADCATPTGRFPTPSPPDVQTLQVLGEAEVSTARDYASRYDAVLVDHYESASPELPDDAIGLDFDLLEEAISDLTSDIAAVWRSRP